MYTFHYMSNYRYEEDRCDFRVKYNAYMARLDDI